MSVDTITYCNIKYQNLGHYYIYIVYLKAVKYIIHSDFYLYIYCLEFEFLRSKTCLKIYPRIMIAVDFIDKKVNAYPVCN